MRRRPGAVAASFQPLTTHHPMDNIDNTPQESARDMMVSELRMLSKINMNDPKRSMQEYLLHHGKVIELKEKVTTDDMKNAIKLMQDYARGNRMILAYSLTSNLCYLKDNELKAAFLISEKYGAAELIRILKGYSIVVA